MDPRAAIVDERLKGVARVVLVCSGKGGVGKSLVASLSSLLAAREGLRVGLLDIDFHGPSCHTILGASGVKPVEERGLTPPVVAGVKLMSLNFFAEGQPLPLRGEEVTDALLELLAVTIWGNLDVLFIDSPPGTGEEVLDTLRLTKRAEALVVTTPSRLSLATVSRLVKLLRELRTPVLGLVENFGYGSDAVRRSAEEWGVRYLGWLPYYPELEEVIGQPDKLVRTPVALHLREALRAAQLI